MGTVTQYVCSFCDGKQADLKVIIKRDVTDGYVSICDECVIVCVEEMIQRTPKATIDKGPVYFP